MEAVRQPFEAGIVSVRPKSLSLRAVRRGRSCSAASAGAVPPVSRVGRNRHRSSGTTPHRNRLRIMARSLRDCPTPGYGVGGVVLPALRNHPIMPIRNRLEQHYHSNGDPQALQIGSSGQLASAALGPVFSIRQWETRLTTEHVFVCTGRGLLPLVGVQESRERL